MSAGIPLFPGGLVPRLPCWLCRSGEAVRSGIGRASGGPGSSVRPGLAVAIAPSSPDSRADAACRASRFLAGFLQGSGVLATGEDGNSTTRGNDFMAFAGLAGTINGAVPGSADFGGFPGIYCGVFADPVPEPAPGAARRAAIPRPSAFCPDPSSPARPIRWCAPSRCRREEGRGRPIQERGRGAAAAQVPAWLRHPGRLGSAPAGRVVSGAYHLDARFCCRAGRSEPGYSRGSLHAACASDPGGQGRAFRP